MQQEAIDAVFEEFGEPAEYTTADGSARTIIIRRQSVNTSVELFDVGVVLSPAGQLGAFSALVRSSEVETPAEGDHLATGDGRRYAVHDTPRYNGFGVWRLPLVEET